VWAKATRWMLLAVLGATGGCGVSQFADRLFRGKPERQSARYSSQVLRDLDEAVALTRRLQYADAEAKLSQLLPIFETAEDHERAAQVTFWLGYCSEKQGRRGEAEKLYDRVLSTYPDSRAAPQAAKRLAILRLPATTTNRSL
jgi:TolA-binding protein